MRTVLIAPIACALILLSTTLAYASPNAYVRIDGIPGDSTVQSLERGDTIEAVELHFGATRGSYGAIQFRKRIDRASPLLMQRLVAGATIPEVQIRFFRPSPGGSGAEEQYYTITLQNVTVSRIDTDMASTLDPQTAPRPMTELVQLSYQRLTTKYEPTSASATATNSTQVRTLAR